MRAGYSLHMVTADPSEAADILHNQHSHDGCWASLCKVVIDLHTQLTHRMLQYRGCCECVSWSNICLCGVWTRGFMIIRGSRVTSGCHESQSSHGKKFGHILSQYSTHSHRDSLDEKPESNLFSGPHLRMFTVINGLSWAPVCVASVPCNVWCHWWSWPGPGPLTRVSLFINYYPPVHVVPRSPVWPWPDLTKLCKL